MREQCPACRRWHEILPARCQTSGCGAAFCTDECRQMHVCHVRLESKVALTDRLVSERRRVS